MSFSLWIYLCVLKTRIQHNLWYMMIWKGPAPWHCKWPSSWLDGASALAFCGVSVLLVWEHLPALWWLGSRAVRLPGHCQTNVGQAGQLLRGVCWASRREGWQEGWTEAGVQEHWMVGVQACVDAAGQGVSNLKWGALAGKRLWWEGRWATQGQVWFVISHITVTKLVIQHQR